MMNAFFAVQKGWAGRQERIVRLEAADTFHPTSPEFRMALYFHPGSMEKDVERRLNSLIKWLASQAPDVISE